MKWISIKHKLLPPNILQFLTAAVVLSACSYVVWNGRKVVKAWMDQDNKIPSVPIVPWEQDDNNPANWYLKNSGKIRSVNNE